MNSSIVTEAFLTTLVCLANFDNKEVKEEKGFDVRQSSDQITFPEDDESCPTEELNSLFLEILNFNETNSQRNRRIIYIDEALKVTENKIRRMQEEPPRQITSCSGQPSGLTSIRDETFGNLLVFCEQNLGIHHGNWLMILKRDVGGQDFYQTWNDYKEGFGVILQEYFIGLEKLHALTSSYINELLVLLEKRTGETAYAHYDAFSIGSEKEQYRLKLLGNYSGTAGDALRYSSGSKFTTRDRDNDQNKVQNCARLHSGAWWYADCMESNLFGLFQTFGAPDRKDGRGILWKGFLDGPEGSIKVSRMYVRPRVSN